MKILKKIRDYLCYYGIEKDEYEAIKKGAYASNFEVWQILHCLMSIAFAGLFIYSVFGKILAANRLFYLFALVYSMIATGVFFVLKKDSVVAQLMVYLSITVLFLFGCLITQNKPDTPATTFVALLLITPMFMINKPYFMALELGGVSAVFLIWMYHVKPYNVWQMDAVNVSIYAFVGLFVHIVANSVRIREFVLTRKINIQKDLDELTGLKNKAALTKEINEYLADNSKNKGIMLMLDINNFKMVNDTYGHDVGDSIIHQFGVFLSQIFTHDEILGRFGGDEFIVFIKNTDDPVKAGDLARAIVNNTSKHVSLPNSDQKIGVSIGVAIYHGEEKNYSEIFKKADIALYKTKADRDLGFCICQ